MRSSFEDGILYCQFSRETNTIVKGKTFDLVKDRYQLMIVSGDDVKGKFIFYLMSTYHILLIYYIVIFFTIKFSDDHVGFHSKVFVVSESKVALAEVGDIAGASKLLLRLHGAFMLIAWIGTSSCGILLAR